MAASSSFCSLVHYTSFLHVRVPSSLSLALLLLQSYMTHPFSSPFEYRYRSCPPHASNVTRPMHSYPRLFCTCFTSLSSFFLYLRHSLVLILLYHSCSTKVLHVFKTSLVPGMLSSSLPLPCVYSRALSRDRLASFSTLALCFRSPSSPRAIVRSNLASRTSSHRLKG
jgi:hypothetical protein